MHLRLLLQTSLCLPFLVTATEDPVVLPGAVKDFWHDGEKQHRFHFPPKWADETEGSLQFYAWKDQAEGTDPVYAWWDKANQQHTFHFEPAWDHGGTMEQKAEIQFYAYKEEAPHTQQVYAFWDSVNGQHTFHFEPAWKHGESAEGPEEKGDAVFYAYPKLWLPSPVYDFWHDGEKQHRFHFKPAWEDEKVGQLQFYAWTDPQPDADPVYSWWDGANKQHTFHFEPAWKHGEVDEIKGDIVFYAYKNEAQNTEQVFSFWDSVNQQHTFHFEPTWKHGTEADAEESKGDPVFWAFRTQSTDTPTTVAPVTNKAVETAKLRFNQGSPFTNEEEFLQKCSTALQAKGITCTTVEEQEGGILEIEVSGTPDALAALQEAGGWDDVELEEVDAMLPPTGASAPQVTSKSNDTDVSASAPVVCAKALIFSAVPFGVLGYHAM